MRVLAVLCCCEKLSHSGRTIYIHIIIVKKTDTRLPILDSVFVAKRITVYPDKLRCERYNLWEYITQL